MCGARSWMSLNNKHQEMCKGLKKFRKEIKENICLAGGQFHSENLAGNIVKSEFWKGELVAYQIIETMLDKFNLEIKSMED